MLPMDIKVYMYPAHAGMVPWVKLHQHFLSFLVLNLLYKIYSASVCSLYVQVYLLMYIGQCFLAYVIGCI
jgi:hypothetical protein